MNAFRPAVLLLYVTLVTAQAESLLPTGDGTTWEYELREQPPNPNGTAGVTVLISGTEQLRAKKLLRLETRTGGELTQTDLIEVDDTGVHCYRRTPANGKSVDFNPPQTRIPAPLQVGAKWELDDRVAGTDMHQQFSVTAQENVTVPAGTYHAYLLHCEQPWPLSIAIDRWFAPGVGMVKDVTTTRGPNGRLLSRVTSVLKSVDQTAAPTPSPTPESTPEVSPPPTAEPSIAPATSLAQPGEGATGPNISLEVAAAREGQLQTEFRSDAPNIFVRWRGEQLPIDAKVRLTWVAEDVGDLAPHNFVVDETKATVRQPNYAARFTLSRPEDGWAPGKYRIDVYLDDDLVKSMSVTIHD